MIVDACLFHNEFDLLEIRLRELAPVVDRFVLVEATHTFTGHDKPLYYQQRAGRYAAWADRLVHVVVDDLPIAPGLTAWDREAHQRNAISRGLTGVPDRAVVLISDVDELPHPAAVHRVAGYLHGWPDDTPISFAQVLSFYRLNNRCHTQPVWYGTQAATARVVRHETPERIRTRRQRPRDVLGYAGWHATNLGDADWLRHKLQSFSHTEVATPAVTDLAHLARCIAAGVDPSGRTDILFRAEPIDGSYPATVLSDLPRWAHLFTPGSVERWLGLTPAQEVTA